MCGIAGYLGPRLEPSASVKAAFHSSLSHRGPDAEGFKNIQIKGRTDREVLLCHNRLSIIDLSDRASQPMQLPGSSHCIVYNGEIYNYRRLRDDLGPGIAWQSNSDTEVLLRLFSNRGILALEEIRGMYAFAIWDAAEQRLLLAVDPLGIKPLYYWQGQGGRFAFASEVRALLDSGLVERRVDQAALDGYLSFGAVLGPSTIIAGVKILQGGHWLSIDRDGNVSGPFAHWTPSFGDQQVTSTSGLRDLIETIVAEHLVSDVPLGLFLSGGIDSSALAILAARHDSRLRTFSVTFDDKNLSEATHSRTIARLLASQHTELELSESDLLSLLPSALEALDQPTLDGTNVFVISKAVRSSGIKVALSGQGGDELFAGYPTFGRIARSEPWRRMLNWVPRKARTTAAAIAGAWQRRAMPGKLEQLLEGSADIVDTYLLLRQLFPLSIRRRLLPLDTELNASGLSLDRMSRLKSACKGLDPINAVSHLELNTYLADMLLRDGDVMSMAHNLEVRVPFLDRRIVDAVTSIRGSEKMDENRPKPLLLDILGEALPESIYARPKQGFTFPWERWLRGSLKPFAENALLDVDTYNRLGMSPTEVRRLWQAFLNEEKGVSWSRIWALVALREWAHHQNVSI